ncbi:hypothetical protein BY996DRAFT_3172704 [Phakopsora pachyrhizi]|nr:hypothetical protein BY996DRAFT_3172704 [Phakopsora pachyrhizi]
MQANEQRYARQRRDDQQVLIENRTITERQQSQVMTIDEREEDQDFERGGLFVLEDWLGYERILCEPSDRLSNSDEDHDETQGRANDCGGDPSMVRILLKALIDDEKINYTNFFNRRRRMFREVESLRRALLPRNRNSSSREEEYYEEEEDERKERSYWSQKGRSEEEFVEYLMTLSRIVKVEDSRKLLMEKEGEGRRVEGEKGKVEGCDETRFLEGGGEMRNGLRRSQRSRGRTRNYFLGGSHHNQDDDHRFERVFDFEKSTLRRIRNFSL